MITVSVHMLLEIYFYIVVLHTKDGYEIYYDIYIIGNRSNDRKLYGYLSKATDGKLVVKFSSHDSRKRVLCVKGIVLNIKV